MRKKLYLKRLKNILKERNIPQRTLAHYCDVSETSLSSIINGKSQPNNSTIDSIASGLSVYSEFLTGEINYSDFNDWKNSNYHYSTEQIETIISFMRSFNYQVVPDSPSIDLITVVTPDQKKKVIDKIHFNILINNFITLFDSYLIDYEKIKL